MLFLLFLILSFSLALSTISTVAIFRGVSEYECNIFVRELIFNGSAGSVRVMFAIVVAVLLELMMPFIGGRVAFFPTKHDDHKNK